MDKQSQIIDIYEKYYVSLEKGLLPCLKGFQLALMPALEEDGNEFFDRVGTIHEYFVSWGST